MKNLLLSLAFIITLNSFSCFAQYPDFGGERFDTILFKKWENNNWVLESRYFNDYVSDCNIHSTTIQTLENDEWINNSRQSFTYLSSKKVDQSFSYYWEDPEWVLYGRTTHTYNASQQLIKELTEVFVNNTWMGQAQTIYSYDGNGHESSEVTQTWTGSEFINSHRTDYWNTSAGMIKDERSQNWNGIAWQNVDSTHYEYNGNQGVSSAISFLWSVNQWENDVKSVSTYVNNILTQVTEQEWKNNVWVNSDRSTLSYDGKGRPFSLLDEDWDEQGKTWVNAFFETFSYTSACSVLPLTLLEFDAELKSGVVFLQWETTNEVNTSGFIVQKSSDGITFKSIGSVPSSGGKSVNKYSYKDRLENGLEGILYYRLLMNDIDGRTTLSEVEKVQLNAPGNITIFPNPVGDHLSFVLPSPHLNTNVRIADQKGRTVLKQRFENISGGTTTTLDVSLLPKGFYLLQISDGKSILSKKFIKQ